MSSKIIAIGDPHFKTDNIPEVEMFIDRIEMLIKEEKPDLIVILGDLLHTHERLHTVPLNKAYDFVNRMRSIALTYVLVGNHDMICNGEYLSENHWMNGMKEWENIVIVDVPKELILKDNKFIFCPYVYPRRFKEALSTLKEGWENANTIFCHQEFAGCKMGAIVSIEGDKWEENDPFIIAGHIHSKQRPQNNIYYPGSSMQHAFGESEKNIIAVVTFEGKEHSIKEVDLGLPRKKTLYLGVEEVEDLVLPNVRDKFRVTVKGNYEEFKTLKKTKKYKELIDKGVKIVFKVSKEERKEEEHSDLFDFQNILHTIVEREKDPYLIEVYELVVNNKEVNVDDVMFL